MTKSILTCPATRNLTPQCEFESFFLDIINIQIPHQLVLIFSSCNSNRNHVLNKHCKPTYAISFYSPKTRMM